VISHVSLTQTELVPPPQAIPERPRNALIRQGSGRFPGDSPRWQEGNASMRLERGDELEQFGRSASSNSGPATAEALGYWQWRFESWTSSRHHLLSASRLAGRDPGVDPHPQGGVGQLPAWRRSSTTRASAIRCSVPLPMRPLFR